MGGGGEDERCLRMGVKLLRGESSSRPDTEMVAVLLVSTGDVVGGVGVTVGLMMLLLLLLDASVTRNVFFPGTFGFMKASLHDTFFGLKRYRFLDDVGDDIVVGNDGCVFLLSNDGRKQLPCLTAVPALTVVSCEATADVVCLTLLFSAFSRASNLRFKRRIIMRASTSSSRSC